MVDIGASIAPSASGTSGLQGNFADIFGDKIAGGFKPKPWLVVTVLGAVIALALIVATWRKG